MESPTVSPGVPAHVPPGLVRQVDIVNDTGVLANP
jgi:hypothetical protein